MNNKPQTPGERIYSASERRERRRAALGFISEGGIVACGSCVDSMAADAAQDTTARIRFHTDAWQAYNPTPGDDFCSICDADITGVHPNL